MKPTAFAARAQELAAAELGKARRWASAAGVAIIAADMFRAVGLDGDAARCAAAAQANIETFLIELGTAPTSPGDAHD